jgi:hypothetical protein
MTAIEQAAWNLVRFLRANCPPEDVEGPAEAEWPVDISADNEEDAEELDRLFTELEDQFEAAGHEIRKP